MRAVLFHNPTAGAEDHSKDMLLSALQHAGVTASYCSTKDNDLKNLRPSQAELFVVAGGDGTVAKVIAQLPDRSIPVAILPLGTANNIARSLGILDAAVELGEILRPEHWHRLDIGSARGSWGRRRFVEAVGVGVLAYAIQKKSPAKPKGMDGLREGRRILQERIRDADALDVEIVIDGDRLAGDFLAVEVLNVPYTGPALPLAPCANPGDGKFDVVCLPVSGRQDMVSWLEAPEQAPPPLMTRRGRSIAISGTLPHQRVDDHVFDPTDGEDTITIAPEHETATVVAPGKHIACPDARTGGAETV
jgi:diacylglycerol kinase family enzyme